MLPLQLSLRGWVSVTLMSFERTGVGCGNHRKGSPDSAGQRQLGHRHRRSRIRAKEKEAFGERINRVEEGCGGTQTPSSHAITNLSTWLAGPVYGTGSCTGFYRLAERIKKEESQLVKVEDFGENPA